MTEHRLQEVYALWTVDARLVPAIRAYLKNDLNFDYASEFLEWAARRVPSIWNDSVAGVWRLGVTEDKYPGLCEITGRRASCVKFVVLYDEEAGES